MDGVRAGATMTGEILSGPDPDRRAARGAGAERVAELGGLGVVAGTPPVDGDDRLVADTPGVVACRKIRDRTRTDHRTRCRLTSGCGAFRRRGTGSGGPQHHSVPAIGLTSLDQRQPGSNVSRPTSRPSRFKISACPLGKVRTSSSEVLVLSRHDGLPLISLRTRVSREHSLQPGWASGTAGAAVETPVGYGRPDRRLVHISEASSGCWFRRRRSRHPSDPSRPQDRTMCLPRVGFRWHRAAASRSGGHPESSQRSSRRRR